MIPFQTIILSIVALINAIVILVISLQGLRSAANRFFILTAFFVIPWALGTGLFLEADTIEVAKFSLYFFYIAPMFMLLSLLLFATVFPLRNKRAFSISNILYAVLTVLGAGFVLFNQDLFTQSIQMHPDTANLLIVDPFWYTIYFTYFTLGFTLVFIEFLMNIRKTSGNYRKQQTYIIIGMVAVVLLSSVTNLLLPVTGTAENIWLGPLWTLFAVLTITIAIVRHGLFDIKLAAVRSAAYILSLLCLAVIYYIAAYIVSVSLFQGETSAAVSVSPINIILALLLAFVFQPIKRFFDRISNNIFYRDAYDSQSFIAELSELLASTTDMRGLLERASVEIGTTLKAGQCFFFLYYASDKNHHMSAGTKHHSRLPMYDARTLDVYVDAHESETVIITDLLDADSSVRRMLVSHNIAVVMPLHHAKRIIGYLLLGDQRGRGYTKKDIGILETIANELVIAIQNALSVQEVRNINATLQQRIQVATAELRESNAQLHRLDTAKNEFVSMASHQLRTPLTSIKGYVSMMLDGDVGKITDAQRNALEEAYNSSERMVRLISDFLSVSRLQTGKFVIEKKPVDLAKIVEQEVSGLRMIASTHGQKISYVHAKNIPMLPLDEAKIRQVVMNFIDNAIYYSHTNSTIHVGLGVNDDDVVLRVDDAGIGVPEEDKHKLFTKFFRATNARQQRPDGTGVGLFLARKVIAAHGGKVVFESTVGKGSTFGFRIPLHQQTDNTDDNQNDSH